MYEIFKRKLVYFLKFQTKFWMTWFELSLKFAMWVFF